MELGWTCRECGFWNIDNVANCQECMRMHYVAPRRPFELGREERLGLDLPPWRVLRVDADEPLEEASKASDIGRRSKIRNAHCTFPLAATS